MGLPSIGRGKLPGEPYLVSGLWDRWLVKRDHSLQVDKIVQQELSLPKPSREAVQKIFIQGLDEIIDEHSIKITEREKQYYGEINYAGLGNAFTNLRSVKRALNIIYFEYDPKQPI